MDVGDGRVKGAPLARIDLHRKFFIKTVMLHCPVQYNDYMYA